MSFVKASRALWGSCSCWRSWLRRSPVGSPRSLLGLTGGTVPPSTRPLSLQLGPSLREAKIAGTQLTSWKIFCVKTLLLNYVFFVCVVTTFLSLVLKAKIYPLLIFVLF